MIRSLKCANNTAVPHLTDSLMMRTHAGEVLFSADKPNVIIGPNGSGKTALMTALSMVTLTHFTSQSALDPEYLRGRDSDAMWAEPARYDENATFLPGIDIDWDTAAAVFFRPGHIPGNDHSVTAAMMCGYFDQAREYGKKVRNKSSGQAGRALLSDVFSTLQGGAVPRLDESMWRHGNKVEPVTYKSYDRKSQQRINALISLYLNPEQPGRPIILMDEPEQSLDAKSEMQLWHAIEAADKDKLQIIVATHSLYPILHPERFNIIESQPGYGDEVRSLIA